jgi:hypothetical protein
MSNDPHPTDHANAESENASVRFEPRDINTKVILLSLLGIAAVLVAAVIFLWPIYGYLSRLQPPASFPTSPLVKGQYPIGPSQPPLQGTPGQKLPLPVELQQMQEQAEEQLNSYGWVDRQAGVVRIPIAEAMRLLAAGDRSQTDTAKGSEASPGR